MLVCVKPAENHKRAINYKYDGWKGQYYTFILTTKVLCIHEKTESHSYDYYFSKLKFVMKFNMEIVFKASHYTVTGCPL